MAHFIELCLRKYCSRVYGELYGKYRVRFVGHGTIVQVISNECMVRNQQQSVGSIRKVLQDRIEKANPHCELTAEEAKRLNKLERIADKLKRGENVKNRQLQTWLSEEEYEQLEYE